MNHQRVGKKHLTHFKPAKHEQELKRVGMLLGGRYLLIEKIGAGSFGQLYKTEEIETGQFMAAKLEKRKQDDPGLLVREIKVLLDLKDLPGFPQMYFYGRDEYSNYCVMDYLGLNLEQLIQKCSGRFSFLTSLHIGLQILERIEGIFYELIEIVLHSKFLIHRDIKPENIVIGKEDITQLYMIDFGLAKYFVDKEGKHIPYTDKKGIIGTARYASIHAHRGKEQSRRDDLEAIGYMLVYMVKGKLPWMNIQTQDKMEKYRKIQEMKMSTPIEKLCEGLPKCFHKYFQHVGQLQFTEEPNYQMLKGLFETQIATEKETFMCYDWEKLPMYKNKKHNGRNAHMMSSTTKKEKVEPTNANDKSGFTNAFTAGGDDSRVLNKKWQSPHSPRQISKVYSSIGTSKFNNYEASNLLMVKSLHRKRSHTPDKSELQMENRQRWKNSKSVTVVQPQRLQKLPSFTNVPAKPYEEFDDLHEIADDSIGIQVRVLPLARQQPF